MRNLILSLFVSVFVLGTSLPTRAQCTQTIRLTAKCSPDGTIMTVTTNAETLRCGMPEQIPSVENLQIQVQEFNGNWSTVSRILFDNVDLPRDESFDLCLLGISPEATAIRGRVVLLPTEGGVFEAVCHREHLPNC